MVLRLGEFGRQKAVPKRQFLPIKSSANFNSFDLCFLRLLSSLLKELKAICIGTVTEWASSGPRLASRWQSSWELVSFTREASLPVLLVPCSSLAKKSASYYRRIYVTNIRQVLYIVVLREIEALHFYLLLYLLFQPRVENKCALRVCSPPGFSNETLFGGLVLLSFFICPWKGKLIRPVGSIWGPFWMEKNRAGEQLLE